MKFTRIKVVSSILSKEIGWSWPIFFLKCLIKKNALFKKILTKVNEPIKVRLD